MTTGLEAVTTELSSSGFQPVEIPLLVAGAEFEFEAAAVGTGVSHDLVLVATSKTTHQRLIRLTAGLSRALDHMQSRRPVTLIVLGDTPPRAVRNELEEHVRLLLVPEESPTQSDVRHAISVLLPLTLPAAQDAGKDPMGEVVKALGASVSFEHLTLLQEASGGADAVRAALKKFIDDALAGDLDEAGEP